MQRAASQPGLAFVGWTRATAWEKVVFVKLPPIEDFLAIRIQSEFKARELFERIADNLHDEFLLRRGSTDAAQIAAHQEHLQESTRACQGQEATQAEIDNIAFMLKLRGGAAVLVLGYAWPRG